jgi:hypothetical protein
MKREPPTPWNPSRGATKRVTNPLPLPTHCRHCGAPCSIVSSASVYKYGDWPWCVLCSGCGAHVGLHPYTNIPLGTLATPSIRAARKRAIRAFNTLWESGEMTRKEAYAWLAQEMHIDDVNESTIARFDTAYCSRVVTLVKRRERAAAVPPPN